MEKQMVLPSCGSCQLTCPGGFHALLLGFCFLLLLFLVILFGQKPEPRGIPHGVQCAQSCSFVAVVTHTQGKQICFLQGSSLLVKSCLMEVTALDGPAGTAQPPPLGAYLCWRWASLSCCD